MLENSENLNLLALETSGVTSGIYISQNQDMFGQITLHQKNIHSRRLSLSLKQLLDHLQLSISDINAIIDVLLRLSQLVNDFPEIVELDINPLLSFIKGYSAVDIKITITH